MEQELRIALEAVRAACGLCRRVQEALVSAETVAKQDRSPVTVADFGAQAVIISLLRRAFGDIRIVAEEDAGLLRGSAGAELRGRVLDYVRGVPESGFGDTTESELLTAIDGGGYGGGASGRFWTLDPIDGTKGFIRGDQYAVALALIEDGRPVLGVLGCPNLPPDGLVPADDAGVLLAAVRGGGAFQQRIDGNERRSIRVTPEADPSQAVFCESVESAHTAQGKSAAIVEALGVAVAPARIDSQCKYAVVARGDAGVYLRLPTRPGYQEKIWDHAAGALIVEEAGGRVTDVAGKPLDFAHGRTLSGNRGVVATNGHLHEAVLSAFGAVTGDV